MSSRQSMAAGFSNFGHQIDAPVNETAHLFYILRPLHEGKRDPVGAHARPNSRSRRSFSVSAQSGRTMPTMLTPLPSESVAPTSTRVSA